MKERCYIITVAILAITVADVCPGQSFQRPFKGALFGSLFYSFLPEYRADNIATGHLPEDLRVRLEAYQRRSRNFQPLVDDCGALAGVESCRCDKQRAVEKGIVSLIGSPGVEAVASRYARDAVLYYEWEGFADGPLAEAGYAERYLSRRPATVLKPYLWLFLAHRYRCAYECLEYEKKFKDQELVARKYRYYLRRAREHPDRLVGLIAEDLDTEPYLYIKTNSHP